MSSQTQVTLSKGGSEQTTVPINEVHIPDLWHVTEAIRTTGKVHDGPGCADLILECWNIAHDLKRHIQEAI